MQSINEELQTVNGELQHQERGLGAPNDDLQNLLDSTQIATLFLDRDLRIRNFTPAMTEIFHVREGDIGRPITDIVSNINYDRLPSDAEDVQRTLRVIEREVQPRQGESGVFLLRMRPYRTVDDRLDGVVLTFMDITAMKVAQQAGDRLASIVQSSNEAIISKTLDGIVASWNKGAERLFGYTADEMVGQSITLLIPPGNDDEEPTILARLRRGERGRTLRDHPAAQGWRPDRHFADHIPDQGRRTARSWAPRRSPHDIGERKRTEKLLRTVMHELSPLQEPAVGDPGHGATDRPAQPFRRDLPGPVQCPAPRSRGLAGPAGQSGLEWRAARRPRAPATRCPSAKEMGAASSSRGRPCSSSPTPRRHWALPCMSWRPMRPSMARFRLPEAVLPCTGSLSRAGACRGFACPGARVGARASTHLNGAVSGGC